MKRNEFKRHMRLQHDIVIGNADKSKNGNVGRVQEFLGRKTDGQVVFGEMSSQQNSGNFKNVQKVFGTKTDYYRPCLHLLTRKVELNERCRNK